MKVPTTPWRSLKTRITLLTLAIFVLSMTTVTLWTGHMLRQDMQSMLEQQQFSTATILAAEINHELADRLRAIEQAATSLPPALLTDAAALQQHLAAHPVLQAMFNAGTFVTTLEGTAVASLPIFSQRVGVNFMDRDFLTSTLQKAKATISKPFMDPQQNRPLVSMAAPVRGAKGQIFGALVGVIDLGETNFLDNVIGHPYGQNGSFMLVDKVSRLYVTDTDKKRVLKALPAPGMDVLTDQFVAGHEGSGIGMTTDGQQVLVAAKNIPSVNWYIAIHWPTTEAFFPINALQQRMWWAMALLTLLTTSLIWWMLRRQFVPLVSTATTLAALPANTQFPVELPIAVNDEIGHLIAGFNRLLKTLQQREQTLKESEERFRTLTEWTPEALMVHRNDKFLYVNPAAIRLFGASTAQDLLGKSVLDLIHPDNRQNVIEQIQNCTVTGAIPINEGKFLRLDGNVFDAEISSIAIQFDGHPAVQTAAHDITERKRAVTELQTILRDKVALLNEVHHRVKNNLQVITSLLRLESGRSKQPDTQAVLNDMQSRIRSMALLHEMLYRSATFATVNLAEYLQQLATQAFRAQAHGAVQLQLAFNPVQVSMDMATHCGLLVNELISNALKHAFPGLRQGVVQISLQPVDLPQEGGRTWCMSVIDNGVGLPANFEHRRSQSLGLQLATDLARQLGSVLDVQSNPDDTTGACFSVRFTPDCTSTGQTP